MLLYKAVTLLMTDQSASRFSPWQMCSLEHRFLLYGNNSTMLQLLRKDFVHRYPQVFIAWYSSVHLNELEQGRVNTLAEVSDGQQDDLRYHYQCIRTL